MKKENKKLAQKRKAAEKKKQAIMNVLNNALKYGIPCCLLIGFFAICIINPFEKKETDNSSGTTNTEASTNSTDSTASAQTTLSSDKSLTVKNGDTVNIDFVGSIDGVEFEGGNSMGLGSDLTIGSGSFIDDFEEQLIGSHPGDEVDVYATFPENYGNEELNGKEALFKVTVNGIYIED